MKHEKMSTPQASRDLNKDGIDDNKVDTAKSGSNYFGDFLKDFTGTKVSKDDALGRDIRYGVAGSEYGKFSDDYRTRGQADDQAGRSKDYVNTMAEIETRNQRESRADEFKYVQRDYDKQLQVVDEMENRNMGRNLVNMQATGEQQRKNYKEQGAQGRETYDFEDTIDARGEERDRDRSNRLARSF
jgi:hypothetical protein